MNVINVSVTDSFHSSYSEQAQTPTTMTVINTKNTTYVIIILHYRLCFSQGLRPATISLVVLISCDSDPKGCSFTFQTITAPADLINELVKPVTSVLPF